MGQTLTHGVYLPDEGERNCYSGLAANWQILDTSVGTIAEHTSALSGKAPLVHTHSKADITDFPAYGTTAGTICEGNDSRLSDARTPVAHTHTKSDVTDLFNSANTWTGNNTFSGSNSFNSGLTINNAALLNAVLQNAVKGDVSTTGDFAIFIKDKVNGNAATSLLAVYRGGQDSGGSYAQINIDTKGNDNNRYNNGILLRINPADNSNNAVLIPQRDKTIDLGTSSYQWNNLYAKNYYYNGVAWGLDKANVWTQDQVIATNNDKCYIVKDTVYELGQTYPNGEHLGGLIIQDKNGSVVGFIDITDRSYGSTEMRIRVQQKFDPDSNNRSTNGTIFWNEIVFGIAPNKTNYVKLDANLIGPNHDLGTPTNKWKSLNGINPGALSIFNPSATQDPIDIPNTWITDGSAWNTLNVSDMGDGWICLTYRLCGTDDYILARFGGINANTYPSMLFPATRLEDTKYYLYVLMPVAKAMGNIYLEIKLDSNAVLVKHSFIPAYGTV